LREFFPEGMNRGRLAKGRSSSISRLVDTTRKRAGDDLAGDYQRREHNERLALLGVCRSTNRPAAQAGFDAAVFAAPDRHVRLEERRVS
jgi:hypothetical protein